MPRPPSDIAEIFAQESARLTAVLTRILGPRNLELAEDVVQDAFVTAAQRWAADGVPRDPAAWLMRTARNRAIDCIRRERPRRHLAEDLATLLDSDLTLGATVDRAFDDANVRDDTLTMIFLCCTIDAPIEHRIALILRSLCGLRVDAIARALLVTEATAKKRLVRMRKRLRGVAFRLPTPEQVPETLRTTHLALYLLFNEGYLSIGGEPIQHALCRQAMFLTRHLTDDPRHSDASTHALLALMCFHAGRLSARTDAHGALVPIDLQDRSRWDRALHAAGFASLRRAQVLEPRWATRYLVEAAIAAQHCAAPSFDETGWVQVCDLYDHLMAVSPSPVAALNRAVARSYRDGPAAAVPTVVALREAHPKVLAGHAEAVLAHLHARAGSSDDAARYCEAAAKANAPYALAMLERQIARALRAAGVPDA